MAIQKKKPILLCMLFGLLIQFNLSAREVNIVFKNLSVELGLSQNTVTAILQDRKGFMWFGTQDGLNRYDGHEFVIHKFSADEPGKLSDNYIQTLYEDQDGIIWIGTQNGGLNRFDPEMERFTRFKHLPGDPGSLSNNTVFSIYEDSRGILWIGTDNGLNRFDRKRGTFIPYSHNPQDPDTLSNSSIRCIIEDRKGILWIGTWGGLNRLEHSNHNTYKFTSYHESRDTNSLTDDRISSICLDPTGNLFIGTENGFTHFNPVTGVSTRYREPPGSPNSLADNKINVLFQDNPEYLWIGTHTGLFLFNCKTKKISGYPYIPNMPYSLGNNQINSIYKDRVGDLWIGIWADGLYHSDRSSNQFKTYRKDTDNPNSLSDSDITSIYQDRKGIFWIGTMKGLNRFDRNNYRFTQYQSKTGDPNSLSHNEVYCILEDHSQVLWVGTRGGGLNRFDRDKNQFTHYKHEAGNPNSLSDNWVNWICEDHTRVLWVGTQEGGLNRLDADRKQFIRYKHHSYLPHSLSSNNVHVIYEDRSGILWIGTEHGGLNRFNPGTQQFTHYKHNPRYPNSISHSSVISILEDSRGQLWIGTMGGGINLFNVSREQFTPFTKKDGLPDNVIYGILEDEKGALWLSTAKGLSHFETNTKQFKNYGWADGLQSYEFNEGAFYKSKTGEMFFGGINGYNAFYPENIIGNKNVPPVVFTGFQLFNKPVKIGESIGRRILLGKSISETEVIKLTFKEKIFSFQFAALNYVYPKENKYEYMMENFEEEWNKVGNRNFAAYNNLPAGEYIFRVKGSNNAGVWNKEGASLKVIIIPPFWQTWWFKLMLLMAALGLVYFIFRLRIRSIEKQRKVLERKVEQRTRELKIANQYKSEFLARMSHEIRTPMNSVIGFTDMLLDTKLNEEQVNYARTIHHSGQTLLVLIDDILDLSKIEAGQLTFDPIDFDPEIVAFNVCESIMPRVGNKPIEILCRIGDQVPAFVKTDPGRFRQVLLNLMGNAVKFTEEGEVELSLDVEEEEENRLKLHTAVRDTGIGVPADKLGTIFDAFQQVDGSVTRQYGGTGLGLAICKQIAKMMLGDVWAESSPGAGTIFHFTAYVEKSKKKAPPGIIPPHLSGKKVLVVDDNINNLGILTHILEKVGMRVQGLGSGVEVAAELLDAFQAGEPFDLCILDIHLPGMSGYDVLKKIRSHNSFANLPVLAFSSSTLGRSKRMRDAGFDGFLPKPINRQKLISMTARLLAGKEARGKKGERETLLTQHTLIEEAKHSVRILLAEDDPINRKLAKFMLTKAGYNLDIVNNGKEAVETYARAPEKYDIILMDVQMPVMDGKKATEIIRGKGFKKIPIIAVTADVMKGDREKLMAAGMNDYISKPIKREVVFEKVKKWAIDLK